MYKKIKIENFRGIKSLECNDPRQFNLIVGENNSCKTSIIEAIFLLTGPTSPDIPVRINKLRGYHLVNDYSWSLIFHQLDTSLPVILQGELTLPKEKRYLTIRPSKTTVIEKTAGITGHPLGEITSTSRGQRINGLTFEYRIKEEKKKKPQEFTSGIKWTGQDMQFSLPGDYKNPLSGIYIHPNYGAVDNARRFSDIQVKKQEGKIIKILKKIEPRIIDLSVGSDDILYCDMGFDVLIPLNIVGAGINRLLSIILAIYHASGGIVLIDEVENGFHYSALSFLWEAIFESAREFNVQVFATTHSYENIIAYNAAYEKSITKNEIGDDDLRLFRIEREKKELHLIQIDHRMLKTTIENDLEVR